MEKARKGKTKAGLQLKNKCKGEARGVLGNGRNIREHTGDESLSQERGKQT